MKKALLIIFVGLVVFLAGCAKEKPEELQFKNDVVTIENYFVSNVAPYEKGETSIQFDVHNNGDQKIPYLEVEFFDTPGFKVVNSVKCEPIGNPVGESKCVFLDNNALEPLDVRSITIQLKSTEDVSSPTPHATSFAVRYTYFGSREASIPAIDGQTRKQPLTKFRQNDPSVGPIALDIDPSIEREIIAGDKTIRENWAIGGENPLPFLTKFKFRHVGTVDKIKDVNITLSSVRLKLGGLNEQDTCDFCKISQTCKTDKSKCTSSENMCIQFFKQKIIDPTNNNQPLDLSTDSRFYQVSPSPVLFTIDKAQLDLELYSEKSVLVPFDTLICTFKPNIFQPEYSASISAFFAYKYEFIKSQDFVIQPLPE